MIKPQVSLTKRQYNLYTCHTPNGSSTVDYVLVSESILYQVLYFRVSNCIPTLSDTHCKLEWELLAKYKQENISNDNILHPMSPNYIWGDESAVRYTMALGSDEIQNQYYSCSTVKQF